jgi:ATP-dependent RNA helicase DDX18/HAS1
LEKLLQKNYYLSQSAKDGFRSYLQAYASYSLKKIFDVNKLDLAKVGKAFGFIVPPRVNITASEGPKKKRGPDEMDVDGEEEEEVSRSRQVKGRRNNGGYDSKRVAQLGSKRVGKQVYRKDKIGKGSAQQWSR